MASITVASVAKPNSSPIPASTVPSMTPVGGTRKLAINNMILITKHSQKARWFIFVYIVLIDIIFITFFQTKNSPKTKKAALV